MALQRKEFTKAQHQTHTTRVCAWQLFLCLVLCDDFSCLEQRSSFTLSSTPSKILLSQFSRNMQLSAFFNAINFYYLERCPFTEYVGQSKYKYLKHVGRNHVISKKITPGQVVLSFTGQVVSPKILRILVSNYCSVPLSKWP